MKIKKHYIQKKNPQNYHDPLVPNLIKNFLFKRKKYTKLPSPMSAKSDAQLPGFISNEIRIFLDRV